MSDAASWVRSDHRAALMRLAADSPHLAPLCIEVAHQHDCLEDVKQRMIDFPSAMGAIVREELESVANKREQSLGAWWRAARGWLTTGAAILAGAAATWNALHH